MKSESIIQSQITAYLKSRGIYYVKIILSTRNGTPDIICCHNGKFIAIEVKTEQGRISPLQTRAITEIQASGGIAFVTRSLEDVKDFFDRS